MDGSTTPLTRADWAPPGDPSGRLAVALAFANAVDVPRAHDVTSSIDVTLPVTATNVNVVLRVNDQFLPAAAAAARLGGRFALEVRHPVLGRGPGGSALHLVVSARTLVADVGGRSSFYDELLAIAPPVRLSAGIEMRF